MTGIVIADDHVIVRQGLKALLEQDAKFKVIGEASDGIETIELVRELRPDILLLDIIMPSMSGLEVVEILRQDEIDTRIIVFSAHADESYLLNALKNDASGYILKNENIDMLIQAIHTVMNGHHFLSPLLAEKAIGAYLQINNDDQDVYNDPDKLNMLSNREYEVAKMVAEGFTNTSIASHLSISQRTVETHRANIMRKLNLTCQADLVRFAVLNGIVK